MKYFTVLTELKYSWDQVATGFWSRYPNPYSGHVLTEDTTSQSVLSGHLYTKRLLTKTNHLPRWGERFVPGPRHVCIVEESVIDPKTQTLTTYTRNVGYTAIMSVVEKCVYKPSQDNNEWTECKREAWVHSGVFGFAMALQAFGMERFKKNIQKSLKGFNYTLSQLYPPVDIHSTTHSSSAVTLRKRAKTASEIAASVVATN